MQAREAKLLDVLKRSSQQFVIPIYQRTYSWTETECRQLWNDILRAGQKGGPSAHFMGSIVYIQEGVYHASAVSSSLVIDGQQRLTTASLLLAALANALEKLKEEDQREPVPGFSPRKLRNYYLLNPEEDGEQHYKLLLSQTDKETLTAIVRGSPLPKDVSLRVSENYKLFVSFLAGCGEDLVKVCADSPS